MPALVAGIHVSCASGKAWMAPSSGTPELGFMKNRRKSGKPELRDKPGHDATLWMRQTEMRTARAEAPQLDTQQAFPHFADRSLVAGELAAMHRLAVALAYCGGALVAAIGIMSAVSIIGRSASGRPITGDFELVEIGIAVAASLFLPYCQSVHGHIVVDFFTQRAGARLSSWLDRLGCLLMALTFLVVAWRTAIGAVDIFRSGDTSMLLGVPLWIGYAGTIPGVLVAGLIALAQSLGRIGAESTADEQG
jgi:TRAP-type C4-dicarboxylate transport system permease small subunit